MVKAIEVEKAKESLRYVYMSCINHQLKTPLYGVTGPLQLLSKECTNPNWKKYIDISLCSLNQVITTIDCYIKYNEFTNGAVKPIYKLCDLRSEIMNLKHTYEFEVAEKGINLSFELEEGWEYQCDMDLNLLLMALKILIGNAVKYTMKGHVKLRGRRDDANLYILIKDTGIGMPFELVNTLFEEFSELSVSKCKTKTSSGVQLPLCKKIFEILGGTIQVSSVEWEGTNYSIKLPVKFISICEENIKCVDSNQSFVNIPLLFVASASQTKIKTQRKKRRKLRSLIADDNSTNSFVLRKMLEKCGIEVECAINGQEAVNKFSEKSANYYDWYLWILTCLL